MKQKKLNSLIKSVEENFTHENINAEHLQMAIALSKSISENVDDKNEEVYNAVYQSRTLEEFGFKSKSSRFAKNDLNVSSFLCV